LTPEPAQPAPPSVLTMAGPLVVSFWMRAAVTFVDTVYAAILGDAAIAAIGLVVPLEFLMIAVWVGLSTGLTSGLSRAMGQRQGRKIEQYLGVSRRAIAVIAPGFTVLGTAIWFVAPRMNLEAVVAGQFRIYGTVLVVGSAFTTFWSIIPDSLVKAHQDTRSTMWAGIWTNVINFALNTLFLFVFHWGVFGIALSTVLGRLGGLAYSLSRARNHERAREKANRTPGTDLDPRPAKTVLGLAIPSSLTFVLMALETAFVNMLLARRAHATEAIAAYSIYYRFVLFALQPVIAGAVALLPYAAMRFGSRDVAGVRRGLHQMLAASWIYTIVVVAPIMLWAAPWIADSLAESPRTTQYAVFALRTVPAACLVGALFLLCRPVFEALGQGRPGLVMAVLRYGVFMLPLALLGMSRAEALGYSAIDGLVVGLLIASGLSSAIFYGWMRRMLGALGHPNRPS
jgi:Na+-driven multidrug efflux pump